MKFEQIIEHKTEYYEGEVYDLTVEDSHSYNVDDIMVHNSGAGSLVLYTLGITEADPLEYDLLFERFLNPDRGHWPDVDCDFDTKLGPLVFKHINEKYGNEYCSNIITFSRMQPKVIIADVARCLDIPASEVKTYTTNLPEAIDGQEITFDVLFTHPKYKDFFDKHPQVKKFVKYYEGLPRSTGQHAAGIGISSVPVKDISPVILSKDGEVDKMYLSVFEKENYEHFGLIKFDILKLKNIRQVRDILTLVNKDYNLNLTEKDIRLDDKKTWDLINEGNTAGVFQFGDALGKKVIRQVHPNNIEELGACNAFIRPGASGITNYVNGKNGSTSIKYEPRIDKILEKTYGAIVFQEQIMSLISELIGVSFGKADIYRRALEKPKKGKNPQLIEQFNNDVKVKAVERGYSPEVAETIRKLIIDNSGYGFNKSHAVCYSIISYQTAWCKANYPLHFYATMINDCSDVDIAVYLSEAKKMGISILPPDINKSNFNSLPEGNSIRIGFNILKGIGSALIDNIIEQRPFNTLDDFFNAKLNSKTKEVLINTNALSNLPISTTNNITLTPLQINKLSEYLSTAQGKMNYAVPFIKINSNLINTYDFIVEKNNTVVIPAGLLEEFQIEIKDCILTKEEPKGFLAQYSSKNSICEYAFKQHKDEILNLKESPIQSYTRSFEYLNFPIIPHPCAKMEDKVNGLYKGYINDMITNAPYDIVGIVGNIEQQTTKNNNIYYNMEFIGVRETIIVKIWDSLYESIKNYLIKNKRMVIKGYVAYGSFTLKQIVSIAPEE